MIVTAALAQGFGLLPNCKNGFPVIFSYAPRIRASIFSPLPVLSISSTWAHLNKISSSFSCLASELRLIYSFIIPASLLSLLIALLRLYKFPNPCTSGSALISFDMAISGWIVSFKSTLNHISSAVVVVPSLNVTLDVCLIKLPLLVEFIF